MDKPLTHQGETTLPLRAVTQGQIRVNPISAIIRLLDKDGQRQNTVFVLSFAIYPSRCERLVVEGEIRLSPAGIKPLLFQPLFNSQEAATKKCFLLCFGLNCGVHEDHNNAIRLQGLKPAIHDTDQI